MLVCCREQPLLAHWCLDTFSVSFPKFIRESSETLASFVDAMSLLLTSCNATLLTRLVTSTGPLLIRRRLIL
jgi:hypothetical protein